MTIEEAIKEALADLLRKEGIKFSTVVDWDESSYTTHGCPTCDYGSETTYTLTVYYKLNKANSSTLSRDFDIRFSDFVKEATVKLTET